MRRMTGTLIGVEVGHREGIETDAVICLNEITKILSDTATRTTITKASRVGICRETGWMIGVRTIIVMVA